MRKLFKDSKLIKSGNYMRKYGNYVCRTTDIVVYFLQFITSKNFLTFWLSFDSIFSSYLFSELSQYTLYSQYYF